jgi:hypothetical protein
MAELEINNAEDLKKELKKAVENNPNKPTEEEIKAAAAEFESASKTFPSKLWEIGKVKDARTFCDYLKHYVRNRLFWTKNGWMGVVKLNEELQAAENLLNGKEPLKLGYQALEFVYYSLMNPGGIGLQTAQDFESESENYLPLMESVSISLEKARIELKQIQFLQDKYAAMQQGFYLELEPTEGDPASELETPLNLDEPIAVDPGDLAIHPAE